MKKRIIIRKVWKKNNPEQLIITIPNGSYIKEGDYVAIKKIEAMGK
jgi:hypothetical protein